MVQTGSPLHIVNTSSLKKVKNSVHFLFLTVYLGQNRTGRAFYEMYSVKTFPDKSLIYINFLKEKKFEGD